MKNSHKTLLRLGILFKYIALIIVIPLIGSIIFMSGEYGAEVEDKAKNGSNHDKYLAAVHYLQKGYTLDYRCPKSSIPMNTILCYKIASFNSTETEPMSTTNRAVYWLKESIKQKESSESLYLLSQYHLKTGIFERSTKKQSFKLTKPTKLDYEQALLLLEKAHSYSPDSSEINYLIGWIYLNIIGGENISLGKEYLLTAKKLGHSSAGSVLEQHN